ncbi:MAG: hypothetical protein JSW07_05100, partial [bacterium]
TPKELLENLVQITPEFLSAWNKEDNLFIDKDGSLSVHGVFTEFSSFIRDNFSLLDENRRKKLFDYIEECVNTDIYSENGVSNAACTCFLENLAGEGVLSNTILKYLGVQSKKYFDKWN